MSGSGIVQGPNANPPAAAAESSWIPYIPEMPSWDELSNMSCSDLIDRVIHGWQVTLIMGAAVASVIQAVTAIFAGMVGHALLSAGVACVLLFAASYVAQHHLIAETRAQLREAEEHVQNLGNALGQAERLVGIANNAAERLPGAADRVEGAAGRIEPVAENLHQLLPRIQGVFNLFNEQATRERIAELAQAAQNADANRVRFEQSAQEAQQRYTTVAAQLEEATRNLDETRKKLDASVDQAGAKFNRAAQGAQILVQQIQGAVAVTMMGSPDPAHPGLVHA